MRREAGSKEGTCIYIYIGRKEAWMHAKKNISREIFHAPPVLLCTNSLGA